MHVTSRISQGPFIGFAKILTRSSEELEIVGLFSRHASAFLINRKRRVPVGDSSSAFETSIGVLEDSAVGASFFIIPITSYYPFGYHHNLQRCCTQMVSRFVAATQSSYGESSPILF
ncbi:hypothetical protein CRM22_005613 [Opisthorchis felineus]|uniref:Uncharacterized protein n=1 Tax=Opisthorchis felineus TaxID=147828 RepID=A0A4V3SEU4_OPIFE|nr:hypothetical protein CRM22_005613 [Opisthorchis felineus]